MIYLWNLASILFLVLYGQGAVKAPTSDALERLQAKVPVESLASVDVSGIAGHYANPPKELAKQLGGFLDGNDLYLFSDGTYVRDARPGKELLEAVRYLFVSPRIRAGEKDRGIGLARGTNRLPIEIS